MAFRNLTEQSPTAFGTLRHLRTCSLPPDRKSLDHRSHAQHVSNFLCSAPCAFRYPSMPCSRRAMRSPATSMLHTLRMSLVPPQGITVISVYHVPILTDIPKFSKITSVTANRA